MKKPFVSNNPNFGFSKKHFFSGGIFGFSLFFLIIMIVKTISYFIGTISIFRVESEDIFLSLIGLVLMALIKILEDLRLKEPLT